MSICGLEAALLIAFIALMKLATTSKDYDVTVLYTSQATIERTKCSQPVRVLIRRCLLTDFLFLFPRACRLAHLTAAP
jgi:hypothetical protein